MCICACECGTRVYSTCTGPAVRVCTIHVRGLGMNGRVCSFLRASAVCMCTVPVLSLGLSVYSLPGGVYGQNFYLGLCATFPRVHVR